MDKYLDLYFAAEVQNKIVTMMIDRYIFFNNLFDSISGQG